MEQNENKSIKKWVIASIGVIAVSLIASAFVLYSTADTKFVESGSDRIDLTSISKDNKEYYLEVVNSTDGESYNYTALDTEEKGTAPVKESQVYKLVKDDEAHVIKSYEKNKVGDSVEVEYSYEFHIPEGSMKK